ncbi:GCS-domain-containing protein [Neoconidiobolus thromboides FSU 785]|nr:GCS-domain-containing protein [Neoconidiobolus thromboides FSU 785]
MGLLSLGTPLHWETAKQHADKVRKHGIVQFINIYNKLKDRKNDVLLWGDEVEYMMVDVDDENQKARLSLRVHEFLPELQEAENEAIKNDKTVPTAWRPEYGRYMLEGTPGSPYEGSVSDLLKVEDNMKLRRKTAMEFMKGGETLISLTSFPKLGSGDFLEPHHEPNGASSRSLFVPDEIINPHARFPTLTANIRRRRGSKVAINIPIYHDINTPKPFIDPSIPDRNLFHNDKEAKAGAAKPDHIYMDSMCFGMGCSCLQITFQASNILEARYLYDALAPIAPIMLALTAAAPIFRGLLADIDCRWTVIAQSVDDRTPEERGLEPLKNNKFVINKSRYDSIDSYLSLDSNFKDEYNDLDLVYDKDIYNKLRENDIDDLLAKHVSHLFIRDPLVIFEELLDQDDSVSSDHFENLQSTNWQTMRFKPPPPGSSIGWRVEFRSMEAQITDFENAAFAIFIVLLTRAILTFGLNFYVPISKVDENMYRAQKRDAINDQKFFFRKHVFPEDKHEYKSVEEEYAEMSISEIINGKEGGFIGLVPIIESYLTLIHVDVETRCCLKKYLDLVSKRANSSLITTAKWIRNFVHNHKEYKHDSVINDRLNYDLIKAVQKIGEGDYSLAGDLLDPSLMK